MYWRKVINWTIRSCGRRASSSQLPKTRATEKNPGECRWRISTKYWESTEGHQRPKSRKPTASWLASYILTPTPMTRVQKRSSKRSLPHMISSQTLESVNSTMLVQRISAAAVPRVLTRQCSGIYSAAAAADPALRGPEGSRISLTCSAAEEVSAADALPLPEDRILLIS